MAAAPSHEGVATSVAGMAEGGTLPVVLPERLDTAAAPALKHLIEQARAQAGAGRAGLDASAVTYIGGLCLQLLLASGCAVIAPSEKVREAFSLFGVSEVVADLLAPSKEQ
ncbi:STAS domain-containing protein [Acetobacter sp. TBRC 12305]|uniref:Anti-sigma factor antagonist n=1 Tax=Acetobacter garciniae TaxID=2817435 RepID=A0A939HME8_9PROT|nr:STAS domain-containing protein [Acetobacter garciniae]MBO1324771.1 anti-sigma factor antagonist [Acetobacter garciniae]MBX0344462.1 STAS domain-containing protein [Acetobacter garciniae]